jgi:sulfonate transport system substrate-binding protein
MVLRSLIAALALVATLVPAFAQQQQVRIGIGYGLAFLPLYICEDLKLVEKYAKAAQLDEVKVSFPRLSGAAQVRSELAARVIDMGPFGAAPLLADWEKAKDTPQQIVAVSGITSLPLTLLSNQPDEHSLADLKPSDRIAVPTLTSPQMQLLGMQSEKIFGRDDRLRSQVIVLPHADAVGALGEGPTGKDGVAAYFASPPYTEIALRGANVHPILTSADVIGGKLSFIVLGATKAYIESEPRMPEVIDKAMDEAARIIHDDPRRAAQIYLTHEPSGALNSTAMAAVIGDVKDEFGSAVYGMQAMADFMGRHGGLKTPPHSWKDVVAPALLNSPST